MIKLARAISIGLWMCVCVFLGFFIDIPTHIHKLLKLLFQVRDQFFWIHVIVVATVDTDQVDSFLLALLIFEAILVLLVYEKTIVLRFTGAYLIWMPQICIIKSIVFFFPDPVKIFWKILVMLYPVYLQRLTSVLCKISRVPNYVQFQGRTGNRVLLFEICH